MSYHPCVSGCGRFLAPQDGHDRCLTCLGIQHAEEAFVDGSCSSCGDMTISELHKRLRYVKHGGVPLPLPRSSIGTALRPVESEVIWGSRWGLPQVEFLTPQALRSRWSCRRSALGPLLDRVHHAFPSVPPLTTRCRFARFAPHPPKFRGIRLTLVKAVDAPVLRAEIAVLLAKDAIEPVPPADMRSGFYSPYFIVPKKSSGLWLILDLRVLNRALHKLPFKMLMQKHIFGYVRPLDWFAAIDQKDAYFHVSILPRHRPFLWFAFEGRAYQTLCPALRAVPVASRLHQSRGGGPCSPERTGCAHPQLPRRLAHTCTVSRSVVRTQGPGAPAPQPVGSSGQLGKEQTHANAEDLFSRHGVGFGQPDSMPHPGTCSVGAELPQDFIRQDSGPTETLSEAPGAYGCSCSDSSARSAPYEATSALAPWPSPEGGLSLVDSFEEGSAFSETGHPLAPASRPVETPCVVSGQDAEVLGDLPQEVALTIASAQAPSTRRAYALKWNLFVEWCSSHHKDPRRCSIRAVLSFLQQGLERRLSPSTLKVYVAAISAHHNPVEGRLVGKHDLVVRFLRGARRLNPPRPPSLPSWDLALVLRALQIFPFEPLQSVELKFLSMKTLLLTALASIKRVGDLHAFSVDESCLEFGPADSSATLRPRPGYVPKVPTTPFRDQVVNLQALPLEEADPALALLCPESGLRQYVDRTQRFRTSEQLFVCYEGQQKGKAVSKQRIAHWIVDAITLAYEAQGVPCPLRLRAHSTRGVASSWVLQTSVELRAGRLLTRSLGSIACVSNQFPPVFSPQTGSGTERPSSESACGVLND